MFNVLSISIWFCFKILSLYFIPSATFLTCISKFMEWMNNLLQHSKYWRLIQSILLSAANSLFLQNFIAFFLCSSTSSFHIMYTVFLRTHDDFLPFHLRKIEQVYNFSDWFSWSLVLDNNPLQLWICQILVGVLRKVARILYIDMYSFSFLFDIYRWLLLSNDKDNFEIIFRCLFAWKRWS